MRTLALRMHVCDDARMKRITVSLPDDLADEIVRASRIHRKSVSEIVRKSLSKDFEVDATKPRKVPFASLGASGRRWDARNLDDELNKSWADAIRRGWDR
jgi:Arc/MetJ-type ribon-helix-helix transcriptional regulator